MSVNVAVEEKINRKMHELFMQVLKNRDLSRAGDLFSIPDSVIVNDLTVVVWIFLFYPVVNKMCKMFNSRIIIYSVRYLLNTFYGAIKYLIIYVCMFNLLFALQNNLK